MRSYYAARAHEYDQVYAKPERQADLRAMEHWLPPLYAKAHVLEIACGTGYWTQFIARTASRILAVDAAPETLRIAKTRVPANQVTLVVGDAYQPPTQFGKFNAAFAGFWFSHVPKSERHEFLRGLHAVLLPGAKVVLMDNRYVEGSSSPISEEDEEGNTYQTRRLQDGTSHRVLKNFPAESELLAMLEGCGQDAKLTLWRHYWALEYLTPRS